MNSVLPLPLRPCAASVTPVGSSGVDGVGVVPTDTTVGDAGVLPCVAGGCTVGGSDTAAKATSAANGRPRLSPSLPLSRCTARVTREGDRLGGVGGFETPTTALEGTDVVFGTTAGSGGLGTMGRGDRQGDKMAAGGTMISAALGAAD